MNHLHVVSITSDGASSNRKLYRISDANGLTVPYKIENLLGDCRISILFLMFLIWSRSGIVLVILLHIPTVEIDGMCNFNIFVNNVIAYVEKWKRQLAAPCQAIQYREQIITSKNKTVTNLLSSMYGQHHFQRCECGLAAQVSEYLLCLPV